MVLPTPGTPSISKCPRAKMLNQRQADDVVLAANHAAQGFFQLRRALWETAMAVSGDIVANFTMRRSWSAESYLRHGTSCQLSAVSLNLDPSVRSG